MNKLLNFFFVGLSLILTCMIFQVNAQTGVTFNIQSSISGTYAASGMVTDGDIIHYNVSYSGNYNTSKNGSGQILGTYTGTIGSGLCFNIIQLSTSGSIMYYDVDNNLVSSPLDCTVRSFVASVYQDMSSYQWVDRGTSLQWIMNINQNNQRFYKKYNDITSEEELYFWNGMQAVLVDKSTSLSIANSAPNNNKIGQTMYVKYNDITNEYELYFWDGIQSILVDKSSNSINFHNDISDSGDVWYTKYNDVTNEYESYAWNESQSVLLTTNIYNYLIGTNNSGAKIYIVNNNITNEYELYFCDGIQSLLVDSISNSSGAYLVDGWYHDDVNTNGRFVYQKDYIIDTDNFTALYFWDGIQSVLVDTNTGNQTSMRWVLGQTLNDNNQHFYYKNDINTSEIALYMWNGTQSILIDSNVRANNYFLATNLTYHDGKIHYYKRNVDTNEDELYVWNGSQSIFVVSGTAGYVSWNSNLVSGGKASYRIYDTILEYNSLYIWDGSQSIFVDTGEVYWQPNMNNDGQQYYLKYNVDTNVEDLYFWNGSQSIFVDTGEVYRDYEITLSDNGYLSYKKYNPDTGEYDLYMWHELGQFTGALRYDVKVQSGVSTTATGQTVVVSGTHTIGFVDQYAVYAIPVPIMTGIIATGSQGPVGYAGGGGGGVSMLITPTSPQPVIDEPKTPLVFENTDIYNTSISNGYCYKRKSNASIIDSLSITTTQEFKKALTFLYAYDMTVFNKIDEFDPYRRLTREEAAKIFSNFAMNVLCRKPNKNLNISYSDVVDSNPTLKNYITLAYQLGLMKGGRDGKFRPFDTITKAEFNAVLIRMILKSYLPEDSTDKWYREYNDVSADLGIIKYGATEVPVIRNDATVMLFRAYKEQKFDLKTIDYETYVLDTRDDYLHTPLVTEPSPIVLPLTTTSGTAVGGVLSGMTGSNIIKNRPLPRIRVRK